MKVTRPKLKFWERTYFPAILQGLALTFSHIFRRSVTLEYPETRWSLPPQYRGAPVLLTGLDGNEKCTSCKLCQFICPPKAIRIEAGETEREKEKFPQSFTIDMGLCIFCGYCQEVCPVEAIWLKETFELADYERPNLVFNKDKLLEMGRKPPYLQGKEQPIEAQR
ncbi:MAG: NADH-quinone oxidoreductase subunit I [Acidobacteriota bacterium]